MTDAFTKKAQDWDQRSGPQLISEAVGQLLRQEVPWSATMRVMDFGAGTGLVASHVAPLVGKIWAVDVSASMLAQLAAKPELKDKVEIRHQDIVTSPLDETFDAIISAMALHHVQDTAALLDRFRDHLVPGGILALADLDTEDGTFHEPGTEGVYHHGFGRGDLTAQLHTAGFDDVTFRTALEVPRENGRRYPVFFVTARRR